MIREEDLCVSTDGYLMVTDKERKVHVSRNTLTYEPLCGVTEEPGHPLLFALHTKQAYTHHNICPDCAAHEDLPFLLLDEL